MKDFRKIKTDDRTDIILPDKDTNECTDNKVMEKRAGN
jgi:hypothetical protein